MILGGFLVHLEEEELLGEVRVVLELGDPGLVHLDLASGGIKS